MIGQYDDGERTRPMWVHHDVVKHGRDHIDAVNRTCIHLKKGRLVIRVPRLVIDHTIEDAPLCGVMSSCSHGLRAESPYHANVVKLSVQTLVVL
ncbi:hypothetical protein TNCV_4361191 [Trichonephila clavipes]|nr:hypothetical protein TNCV_4361191 [Trichonephila clavipes]